MFLRSMPRQRRLICRLAHPVADFAPNLISILFSDWANGRIDLDQFGGRVAVISKAGISQKRISPMTQSSIAKSMTHGEAGLVLVFSLTAFLCLFAAANAQDTA